MWVDKYRDGSPATGWREIHSSHTTVETPGVTVGGVHSFAPKLTELAGNGRCVARVKDELSHGTRSLRSGSVLIVPQRGTVIRP
jgi:hypothetical protein